MLTLLQHHDGVSARSCCAARLHFAVLYSRALVKLKERTAVPSVQACSGWLQQGRDVT